MNQTVEIKRFIAIDGDDVGPALRTFIINNDIEGATAFSTGLKNYFQELEAWLINHHAKVVFRGGDSVLAYINPTLLSPIIEQIPLGLCSISVGIGNTAAMAYLALQLAKARGKSQIVEILDIDASTIRILNDDVPRKLMGQIREQNKL